MGGKSSAVLPVEEWATVSDSSSRRAFLAEMLSLAEILHQHDVAPPFPAVSKGSAFSMVAIRA